MSVRGLYGNREFHVPFCFMIYVALKFNFTAIISFRHMSPYFNSKKSMDQNGMWNGSAQGDQDMIVAKNRIFLSK